VADDVTGRVREGKPMNRRTVMTALGAGGLAAAGAAALWPAPDALADDAKPGSGDACGTGDRQFVDAVVAAFGKHRL
jgi:hypothetical protein